MMKFLCGFSFFLMSVAMWSSVKPFSKTFHIVDASTAQILIPIQNPNGHTIYNLACYGPKSQPNASDFVYDGEFECRLTEENKAKSEYSTLFTEDPNQSRDWQSRARFFGSELAGQCGEIPQFGREREFLLRGMRISLQIGDVTFGSNKKLKSFTFTVSVQNDREPEAQGQIASAPLIEHRWKDLPCKLDNSVTPHFTRNE
jgi:hypothetical protein